MPRLKPRLLSAVRTYLSFGVVVVAFWGNKSGGSADAARAGACDGTFLPHCRLAASSWLVGRRHEVRRGAPATGCVDTARAGAGAMTLT